MADTATETKIGGQFAEIGVSGLKIYSGYLDEEFLPELRGAQGRRKFREMSENDSTIGAVLAAITQLIRAVSWKTEPSQEAVGGNSKTAAEAEAEFVDSIFDDMSHTHADFLAEACTMLVFGWHYAEIVYKRRVGPDEADPTKRSRYPDGRIGIRKLAPRAQESLLRWEMQDDGGIAGMWQWPPAGGQTVMIPVERALLFRTVSRKNSPEGVSILRTAYRDWYFHAKIQEVEAIGIERELAGLPAVYIPAKYLTSADPADKAVLALYTKIVRDVRNNSQGGVILPSDVWNDTDGNPTANPLVRLELLKTGGARAIDTVAVKQGYQQGMARSMLADFMLLGSTSKGSHALADNKTELFYKACDAFLQEIASVLNRHLLPRLWALNGLDPMLMPQRVPGRLEAVNLEVLGGFLQALGAAGAPLFPDLDLENAIRTEANLPPKSAEAIAYQDEAQRVALNPPAPPEPAKPDPETDGGDTKP